MVWISRLRPKIGQVNAERHVHTEPRKILAEEELLATSVRDRTFNSSPGNVASLNLK